MTTTNKKTGWLRKNWRRKAQERPRPSSKKPRDTPSRPTSKKAHWNDIQHLESELSYNLDIVDRPHVSDDCRKYHRLKADRINKRIQYLREDQGE